MGECPTGECKNHANRITVLEADMKEVQANQRDPRLWVALFGLAGVCFSTMGSLAGVLLAAWAKSQGWM